VCFLLLLVTELLFDSRLESSTAECKRLESKITFVESELKRARDELAGERSQASIDVQTKAQHAELLRKVEQINVLTDSNRMLRQEKDSMQPEINQLQLQVGFVMTCYLYAAIVKLVAVHSN